MKKITRRQFVGGTAALAAGIMLGGKDAALARRMGGGGGGMGGGGVIDPPVGALFTEPVPIGVRVGANVVQVDLEATMAGVSVNGTQANLMTYNGCFPGPTIRASTKDLLRINFKNDLPKRKTTNLLGHPMYTTNLHTHGLHVTPGDNSNGTHGDNMMVMVEPGKTATYEYDLTKQYPETLNFYHPHVHGSVTDQMWAGMAGCLVVDAPDGGPLDQYESRLMVLKDITLAGSDPAPHTSLMDYMHGVEGDTVMMNGQVNPQVPIKPGEIQRWRILNACTARFFRLSLTDHTMYVVGTEAGLLDKPYAVSELLLSPGERVEVLVMADQTAGATYKFLSLPYSRMGNMGGQQVTLATLAYGTEAETYEQTLPQEVDPSAKRDDTDIRSLARKQISLSMGQGSGYINGIKFVDHENCAKIMSKLGGYEVWEITNESNMDHPFHHHVNRAQVLSITGGHPGYASLYTTTPSWKDVTIVPKFGKVELLMPVLDYPGHAMVHCHIIEHEDIGMMAMWHIM